MNVAPRHIQSMPNIEPPKRTVYATSRVWPPETFTDVTQREIMAAADHMAELCVLAGADSRGRERPEIVSARERLKAMVKATGVRE